jgi:hypothetical protein
MSIVAPQLRASVRYAATMHSAVGIKRLRALATTHRSVPELSQNP